MKDPKERPLLFCRDRLFGIVSEPVGEAAGPGLVILNAGLLHRVGPARLSVEVARSIARMGFATFRFDLSGLGDSEPRTQPLGSVGSAVADTREAMDALGEVLGLQHFVLFGLCSGAVHAHHIAAADSRVVGAIMLDGYVFPTLRSRVAAAAARLGPARFVPQRALRWARRRFSVARPIADVAEGEGFLPPWPEKSPTEADLLRLCDRGVRLLYVYTGEWTAYAYEGQMAAAFRAVPFGELLTDVRIMPAEHLYFTRPERDALLATVGRWLGEQPWRPQRAG